MYMEMYMITHVRVASAVQTRLQSESSYSSTLYPVRSGYTINMN